MPFRDAVVGGVNLIKQAIQSPNYKASSTGSPAGWTINQDGSAQFNNISVIGKIIALATDFALQSYSADLVIMYRVKQEWVRYAKRNTGKIPYVSLGNLTNITTTTTATTVLFPREGATNGTDMTALSTADGVPAGVIPTITVEYNIHLDVLCNTAAANIAFICELYVNVWDGNGFVVQDEQIIWTPTAAGNRIALDKTWIFDVNNADPRNPLNGANNANVPGVCTVEVRVRCSGSGASYTVMSPHSRRNSKIRHVDYVWM